MSLGATTCALLALGAAPVLGGGAAQDVPARVRVEGYHVRVTPDFAARAIAGTTTLRLASGSGDVAQVRFPVDPLIVDGVTVGGRSARFTVERGALTIPLDPPLRPGRPTDVTVRYHGAPMKSLVWGDRSVHTTFFTCGWLICDPDPPGDRAPLALELDVPPDLSVVASGRPAGRRALPGGLVRHVWHEDRAMPNYVFGFAIGRLRRARLPSRSARLEAVGEGVDPEHLVRLFRETDAMRAFFEARAGVPLPGPYTQVLVDGREAQEASTLSFIGREFIEPVLSNPHEDWVIAHELAHQWWGNLVTCAAWRDFWLNEGFATFMVAAWKETRWGRADYDREMALARESRDAAARAGFDVPLAWAGEYPSLRARRAIAYSKGALFLDALRQRLGEAAFWNGIRAYTRAYAGKAVESRDLQRAMESATGKDLDDLFAEWVYGR